MSSLISSTFLAPFTYIQPSSGTYSTVFTALVRLFTPLALTLGFYGLWKLIKFIWTEYLFNPLNDFPGPPSPSWVYGNMRQIMDADNSVMHEHWVQDYGPTMKYKVFLGITRLYTIDLKAINHMLMNSQAYRKPAQLRLFLSRILGNGVVVTEGAKHREQRRIMRCPWSCKVCNAIDISMYGTEQYIQMQATNPAFGASQIRELTEIFVEKALELRDVWATEIKNSERGDTAKIDILSGLSKMTLDVIGLAGFDYKFNSLSGKGSELNEAFNTIFSARPRMTMLTILRGLIGRFSLLIPMEGDKEVREAKATMDRIGADLLRDSKAALEKANGSNDMRLKKRDLLSVLLRANMATDVPEQQRMPDQDVLAQVSTFLVAGHETTSNGTTWALYALSIRPEIQSKLRGELFTVSTDNPNMDELNALSYLDAVVRETLRLHPPIPATMRVALKDDLVPLGGSFIDKRGRVRDSILVRKGQTIYLPILATNRAQEIWGEDAREFRPERWESIPEGASAVPGVWGNMLTFFGGPRACIGYRFSLVEMKALLFTLVRAFEFRLAVPESEIGAKTGVVQRPVLNSDPKARGQMPLFVTPYTHVH